MTLTMFQGTDSGATIRLEAEPDGRLELHVKSPRGSAVLAELERAEVLELLENLAAIAAAVGIVDTRTRAMIHTAAGNLTGAKMPAADTDPLQMAEAERIEDEANRRAAERENQRRPERSAILELLEARRRRRPAGAGPTTEELNEETRRYKAAAEERERLAAEEAARLARLELEPTLPGLELPGEDRRQAAMLEEADR